MWEAAGVTLLPAVVALSGLSLGCGAFADPPPRASSPAAALPSASPQPTREIEARLPLGDADPEPDRPAVPAATPDAGLTAAQRDRVAAAVAESPVLDALPQSPDREIVGIVAWVGPTREVVGAGVELSTSPVSGDVVVPYARFDERLDAYEVYTFRWHAGNVTRWQAQVDFRADDRIVSLWPVNGKLAALPGNARFPTSD